MTTQAYRDWIAVGKPYRLARPCRDLQALLKAAGYTVYDYPDERHQLADPPEDHTPYAATGVPVPSKRWIGHALDIMPKAGLMPLPTLARIIIRARDAKVPGTEWIKYMNWTDENGVCRHERWDYETSLRYTTTSSDRDHIHLSAYSNQDDSDTVVRNGWNPLEGAPMSIQDVVTGIAQTANWQSASVKANAEKHGDSASMSLRTLAEYSMEASRYAIPERLTALAQDFAAMNVALAAISAQIQAINDTLKNVLLVQQATPDPVDLATVKQGVKEALKEGIL